jgi:hypothetical protein
MPAENHEALRTVQCQAACRLIDECAYLVQGLTDSGPVVFAVPIAPWQPEQTVPLINIQSAHLSHMVLESSAVNTIMR